MHSNVPARIISVPTISRYALSLDLRVNPHFLARCRTARQVVLRHTSFRDFLGADFVGGAGVVSVKSVNLTLVCRARAIPYWRRCSIACGVLGTRSILKKPSFASSDRARKTKVSSRKKSVYPLGVIGFCADVGIAADVIGAGEASANLGGRAALLMTAIADASSQLSRIVVY
jgi:hypothetical protein